MGRSGKKNYNKINMVKMECDKVEKIGKPRIDGFGKSKQIAKAYSK